MPGLICMHEQHCGMSPAGLQAEELSKFCGRRATLECFGGQMIRHKIQGVCFVTQQGPLQAAVKVLARA